VLAGLSLATAATGVTGGWLLVSRDTPAPAPAATTAGSTGGSGTGTVGSTAKAPGEKDKDDKGVFTISGSVNQLVPGVTQPMTLTITNPNSWDIRVLTIDTAVGSPGVAHCPSSVLTVSPYTHVGGGVIAPRKGSTTMSVAVQLVDSSTINTNGCAGATFPLRFSGTAEKANQ
jgi:hypothetical protein